MGHIAHKDWKSGRYYYAVYKRPNGKQRSEAAGKLKKNAEKLLRRRETEIAEGKYNEKPVSTQFSEFYQQWFESKRRSIKISTEVSIESSFRLHIMPFFGNMRLDEIKPIDIQEWINHMSGKDLAPATVRRCYRYLHSCFQQAYSWELLAENPCRSIILPRIEIKELVFLEPHKISILLAEALEPERTLFAVLAFSGLRLGEALGLAWKHINFQDGMINVERAWSSLGIMQEPKTRSSRRAVPISPTLAMTIGQHYEREGKPDPEDFLFSYEGKQPLDQSNVRSEFTATVKRCGFKHVTIHSLRHSLASALLASGASIKALQRCLGHASAMMTLNIYSHLIPEELGESLIRADAFLSGQKNRKPGPKKEPHEQEKQERGKIRRDDGGIKQ